MATVALVAWAMAMVASVAWAMAVWATAMVASVAWATAVAVAMEATDTVAGVHHSTGDTESLASTKKSLKVDAGGKPPKVFGPTLCFDSAILTPLPWRAVCRLSAYLCVWTLETFAYKAGIYITLHRNNHSV